MAAVLMSASCWVRSLVHLIRQMNLNFNFSELATSGVVTTTNFAIERPTFPKIYHLTSDTTTDSGNGHSSPGTICQETA